jgi:hypothetical protein
MKVKFLAWYMIEEAICWDRYAEMKQLVCRSATCAVVTYRLLGVVDQHIPSVEVGWGCARALLWRM